MRGRSCPDRRCGSIRAGAGVTVSPRPCAARRPLFVALAAVLAAACGLLPDTANVPAAALGAHGDVDTAAANIAAWDFADPGRTHGNPAEAARAVIALEYLAGVVSGSPRYLAASPLVQRQMLDDRQALRRVLGVAPDTRSQEVVDAMMAVEAASTAGDVAAERRALSGPAFTLGPDGTLRQLRRSSAPAGCECGIVAGPVRLPDRRRLERFQADRKRSARSGSLFWRATLLAGCRRSGRCCSGHMRSGIRRAGPRSRRCALCFRPPGSVIGSVIDDYLDKMLHGPHRCTGSPARRRPTCAHWQYLGRAGAPADGRRRGERRTSRRRRTQRRTAASATA